MMSRSLALTRAACFGLGIASIPLARMLRDGPLGGLVDLGEIPTILGASFLGMGAMSVFPALVLHITRGPGGRANDNPGER